MEKSSLEKIVKSDKKNYEIPYPDISKVETEKLSKLWWPYYSEILVHTKKKKHKYRIKDVTYEDLTELLSSTLQEKVTIKR